MSNENRQIATNRDCLLVKKPDMALTLIRLDIQSVLISYGMTRNEAIALGRHFEADIKEHIKSGKIF